MHCTIVIIFHDSFIILSHMIQYTPFLGRILIIPIFIIGLQQLDSIFLICESSFRIIIKKKSKVHF